MSAPDEPEAKETRRHELDPETEAALEGSMRRQRKALGRLAEL